MSPFVEEIIILFCKSKDSSRTYILVGVNFFLKNNLGARLRWHFPQDYIGSLRRLVYDPPPLRIAEGSLAELLKKKKLNT